MSNESTELSLDRAADAIRQADALMIGAGAGMGVDSGLPDFRGNAGFWKAYPAFKGRPFAKMSNPRWFARDPELAWGFFGHRFQLYSKTTPHAGFQILQRIGQRMSASLAVFTSNVDGQFQKAGFDGPIVECHGSIHFLQCAELCSDTIWPAESLQLSVNADIRLTSELPRCHNCGAVARPNILMFGDYAWVPDRTDQQHHEFRRWQKTYRARKFLVIEIGAGTAIPTVRYECESTDATVIRINPRDAHGGGNVISVPLGALDALQRIEQRLVK